MNQRNYRVAQILGAGVLIGALVAAPARAAARTPFPRREQYVPGSPEAIALFRAAARAAVLPRSWAASPGLHQILDRESSGWVGRPNYTFGVQSPSQRESWSSIHDELRRGVVRTRSTAVGLGQLLASNYDRYAPNGRADIGDPLGEAIAMLRYIEGRYGDPETAWAFYRLPRCPAGVSSRYGRSALDVGCKPGEGY